MARMLNLISLLAIIGILGIITACREDNKLPTTTVTVEEYPCVWSTGAFCSWSEVDLVGPIEDDALTEISGLTASRRLRTDSHPRDVLWTHNDSGNNPDVYAIDSADSPVRTIAVVHLKGTANQDWEQDWEDIAAAQINGVPTIIIGDIGDNSGNRDSIKLVVFQEPSITMAGSLQEFNITPNKYQFTYPDGPHDAETLLVHPPTGDAYIVTKASYSNSLVFRAAYPFKSGELEKVAEITLPEEITLSKEMTRLLRRITGQEITGREITGGDISCDGSRLILTTYSGGCEFLLGNNSPFETIFSNSPTVIRLPLLTQREAICYGFFSRSIYTTSEQGPTSNQPVPLYALECQ